MTELAATDGLALFDAAEGVQGKAPPLGAHGLFAATGKAPRDRPRAPDDLYRTPPEATRALLDAERDRLAGRKLWEPAAGHGDMSREIEAAGYDVAISDLVDRGCGAQVRDFFDFARAPEGVSAIVTNPPFCEVNARDGRGRWVTHARAMGVDYMALLLNYAWFFAEGLRPILQRWRVARVYAVCWRIDFTGDGASPMNLAWFVWDGDGPEWPEFRRLYRDQDGRQARLDGSAGALPRAGAE